MRPPPLLGRSWALTVTTSLLMASSLAMADAPVAITVVSGCSTADASSGVCAEAIQGTPTTAGDVQLTCKAGYILESTILEGDLLKVGANLKAACYSMCSAKFVKLKCPKSVEECVAPQFATSQISCPDATSQKLFVNDKTITSSVVCDSTGWKDQSPPNSPVLAFSPTPTDPFVNAYCVKKTIRCDANSYEIDCTGAGCVNPTFDSSKKLSCQGGQKLLVWGLKLYDHAKCTNGGWKGHMAVSDPTPDDLIQFGRKASMLRAQCYTFKCDDKFECPSDPKSNCDKLSLNQDKLTCTDGFLTIGDGIYKDAQCSQDGWKANTKELLKYSNIPFPKMQAHCQDCSTMYVDECDRTGCTDNNKVAYDKATKKISCSANHILTVGDKDYKEITCSNDGWQAGEPPSKILDYSSKVEKLKTKCLSRCHKLFVDAKCTTVPCNGPIYLNEDQLLFCRGTDQLVLNGKEVPDVTCDIAAGWKDEKGTVHVPFSEYPANTHTVKATCKQRPTTPLLPVIDGNVTAAPAAESTAQAGSSKDLLYIAIIVILIGAILIGVASFCWYVKKKKKDDDDENPSQTKTDSKNKSAKNKNGKKGKKGKKSDGKSEKKKGKKGKKEKEKSKKEMEIKSDVEVPEHQMSLPCDSTVPLTAALGVPDGPNPNVMNI